jgi:hypothetical protein
MLQMVQHDVADRKSLRQVRDADLSDGVMNDLRGTQFGAQSRRDEQRRRRASDVSGVPHTRLDAQDELVAPGVHLPRVPRVGEGMQWRQAPLTAVGRVPLRRGLLPVGGARERRLYDHRGSQHEMHRRDFQAETGFVGHSFNSGMEAVGIARVEIRVVR